MSKSKTPCSAIYHGLCVSSWGVINPCCATYGKHFKHMDSNTNIYDYWHNDEYLAKAKELELTDTWLDECLGCKYKIKKGLTSRKDKMKKWYPYIDSEFTRQNPHSIVHFDINFGTACNQKCIMCNSLYSSNWLDDDRKLAEANNPLRIWEQLPLKTWSISYEQLDQIASLVTAETKRIEIKGGEPLYDKRFEYFVNRVLERNPNVAFNTNTNGTHFTDKNIDMLNRIPKINIDVSFDATGIMYEWIRNTKWSVSEQSWDRAMKQLRHRINLNYTTMCYNVDHIETMYNWVAERAQYYGHGVFCSFTQVVTTPKSMAPEYASTERLRNALAQIEHIITDPEGICQEAKHVFEERLHMLHNYIQKASDKKYDSKHYQNFSDMHSTLTKIRGWDIYDHADM